MPILVYLKYYFYNNKNLLKLSKDRRFYFSVEFSDPINNY